MSQSGPIIFISILFLFVLFLSWYVFQAIKTVSLGIELVRIQQTIKWSYWVLMVSLLIWLAYKSVQVFSAGEFASSAQVLSSVFLTLIVTQLVIVIVLLGEDIIRNIQAISVFAMNGAKGYSFPSRTVWVSVLALTFASVPLFSFVYGIKYGKYNFKVHKEILYFEDLPEAFDGFTITQISDIHSGSLKDHTAVANGVQMVLDQKSDLFVFTGDLVNHRADEIEPLIKEFGKIRAKYGQYSILGNHDYGDYSAWPSPEAKKENFEKLKSQHEKLGFDLLLDEHIRIEKDGQSIVLAGVENWGVGFKVKGDLQKALSGTKAGEFKILLSHDPSHWDAQVKNNPNPVHLTLSGHTHGMQFGIETQLVKWSPVQYRYPNWAGLAEDSGNFLYVNRGFGFHAFAGRVGIWPEITVIELKKGKKPNPIHLASSEN